MEFFVVIEECQLYYNLSDFNQVKKSLKNGSVLAITWQLIERPKDGESYMLSSTNRAEFRFWYLLQTCRIGFTEAAAENPKSKKI